MFDRNTPYNDLPLLPPEHDIESKEILKAAISANRALAQLKQRGEMLPRQSILIESLVLKEAKDSSEIELIFTTHDEIYQEDAFESVEVNPHTKEVFRYRQALGQGVELIKTRGMVTNSFIEIVQIIKETNAGIRKTSDTKIVNSDREVIYTPPCGEGLLRDLLRNFEEYLNNDNGIDPLIKMAVLHYQFEAIHPFGDGNGRTGRIINILYLLNENLLDVPVLFLSNYIMKNKTAYYKGLQGVTENSDWTKWILYMLKAVEETSYQTINRIDEILTAMNAYKVEMKKKARKIYSKDLLEVLFEKPFCTIQSLEKRGIAKRQTCSTYLKKLHEEGLLEVKKSGRNVVYINTVLFNILKNDLVTHKVNR